MRPPLLILLGVAFVEDDAVAGFESGGGLNEQAARGLADNRAGADAAALGKQAVDELLVVDAVEEAVGEATGEGLGEVVELFARERKTLAMKRGVDGGPIGLRGGGDVVGAFQAAFDLEGLDTGAREAVDGVVSGQVLRAEQVRFVAEVARLAVDDELVRQAAGLGALATVGAAPAEGFAGEALAAVGDAEGAVDEGFDGDGGGGGDAFDVGRGQFAGEDDAFDAEPADEVDAAGVGEGHLGGAVYWKRGGGDVEEFGKAKVLDDDGIDAGGGEGGDVVDGGGQFIGEDQGVEGDVAANVVGVEIGDDLGELVEGEIGGAMAGVEVAEAEVDRVGAVGDGGAHGVPVAGGREEFRGRGWHRSWTADCTGGFASAEAHPRKTALSPRPRNATPISPSVTASVRRAANPLFSDFNTLLILRPKQM